MPEEYVYAVAHAWVRQRTAAGVSELLSVAAADSLVLDEPATVGMTGARWQDAVWEITAVDEAASSVELQRDGDE